MAAGEVCLEERAGGGVGREGGGGEGEADQLEDGGFAGAFAADDAGGVGGEVDVEGVEVAAVDGEGEEAGVEAGGRRQGSHFCTFAGRGPP